MFFKMRVRQSSKFRFCVAIPPCCGFHLKAGDKGLDAKNPTSYLVGLALQILIYQDLNK